MESYKLSQFYKFRLTPKVRGGYSGLLLLAQTYFCITPNKFSGSDPRNRVYKYSWNGQNLVNPVLLLDLPGIPGPNHDGGKLMIGQDNFLYAIIGDLNRNGKLQNFATGPDPDDTSVILRVSPSDGSPAPGNPFSSDTSNPLSKYYSYGIRNSFGLGQTRLQDGYGIQRMARMSLMK